MAQEKKLLIEGLADKKEYPLSSLLKRKTLESYEMKRYPGIDRLSFKVLPLEGLLKIENDFNTVAEFQATDGFKTVIPLSLLFGPPGGTSAYLALEENWPKLPGKKLTAGPFYLVWKNPEKGGVGKEWWPYQIKKIIIRESLLHAFPGLYPFKNESNRLKKGMNLYVKNCFACHSLNGTGGEKMGPDLNRPMNPVNYFKEGLLEKYIRNPSSVREWPAMEMSGFSRKDINDEELKLLIHYLKEYSKL